MGDIKPCCDETTQHPFANRKAERLSKRLAMFDAENPIPDEITDPETVSKFFKEYKLVPYAGRDKGTGHALLYWYEMLSKLSPTNSACIGKIANYAVGSRAVFVRAEDPEYDPGNERAEMTQAERTAYETALKEIVVFEDGARKFHKNIAKEFKSNGNAFVELAVSTVNGQTRAKLTYHKTKTVLYKATTKGEVRAVLVSASWDAAYLKKHEPKMLPAYPVFIDDGGVKRTMFHLKNGDNVWYGRPDSEGSDIYKYREVQDSIYVTRQSAANFVGQLIIEVEDDDAGDSPAINDEDAKRSGFDGFADRMEQNYTQKGIDPQAVVTTSRPIGAKPMFVFQVKPNTNEKWYEVTGLINEQKIILSHQITQRFMGLDVANGFATDAFVSDYVMNVEPTINELRTTIMNFTNLILTNVWEFAGRQELNDFSLTFKSPIDSRIEEYKTKSTEQNGIDNSI